MENFRFPCCHDLYGCTEEYRPKDIPDHEYWCNFKMIQCPAIDFKTNTICEWEGLSDQIYEHFQQNHSKFILEDGKFEADLITSFSGKFLYAFGQDYFIFTKVTDSNKNAFMCTLAYIGHDRKVSSYWFKITLKTPTGEKTVDITGQIGVTVEISVPTIINYLDNPFTILAEIDVFEKPKDDLNVGVNNSVENALTSVNYEMLEAIRCWVRI